MLIALLEIIKILQTKGNKNTQEMAKKNSNKRFTNRQRTRVGLKKRYPKKISIK